MDKRIEIDSFDCCLLLQFDCSRRVRPVRTLRIDGAWEFGVIKYVETSTRDGREIVEALNHLPVADPARCHTPAFGLELLLKGEQIFACSICWQCNNIFITNKKERGGITFDGSSTEAQRLLARFRSAFDASGE